MYLSEIFVGFRHDWQLNVFLIIYVHLIFCSILRFANQLVVASLSGRRQLIRQLDRTHACTVGPIEKNPPKMRLKKFVKLTGHIYPCHSLTNFLYILWSTSSNRKWKSNLLKFAWKNASNHKIKWTYFVAGFSHLEPLWHGAEKGRGKVRKGWNTDRRNPWFLRLAGQ